MRADGVRTPRSAASKARDLATRKLKRRRLIAAGRCYPCGMPRGKGGTTAQCRPCADGRK